MGRRGPAKTPTALAKLKGNPGHRRLNNQEPSPPIPASVPDAPEWLDAEGAKMWNRRAGTLHGMRLLTQNDIESLAKYCDCWSRWCIARDFLRKHGDSYPVKTADGKLKCMIQFPQVAIYRNLLVSMQRYEQEFGMTPASRTRISIKDEASADDDGGFDFEVPPLRLAK